MNTDKPSPASAQVDEEEEESTPIPKPEEEEGQGDRLQSKEPVYFAGKAPSPKDSKMRFSNVCVEEVPSLPEGESTPVLKRKHEEVMKFCTTENKENKENYVNCCRTGTIDLFCQFPSLLC